MFRVEVQEVVITEAGNGPRKYKVADVVYTWNGNNRKQRVMSFANPDVFKTISGISTPTSVEVEVTKNAKGYDEWAKVSVLGNLPSTQAPAASKTGGGKVLGSNYETAEERAKRQLMIVRQSSIANALTYHEKDDVRPNLDDVLSTAQVFVDFVYGTDEALETLERMPSDIPE